MPSILLFGATGLIGAPLAKQLKQAHSDWPLTVFYRNDKADDWFKTEVQVDRIVHGTFDDAETIKTLSKEHDIVLNAASSFDAALTDAIIAGLKENPKSKPALIHLSGSGNFIDYGKTGSFNASSKVWNDNKQEDIKLIHPGMFNGLVDTMILKAGEDTKIATHIINLPVTYGRRVGPTTSVGIGYTLLTSNAKALGFVPYIGDGSAVVNTLHYNDAIPFILSTLERASQIEDTNAYERYYMLDGHSLEWKNVAASLAKVMYKAGAVSSPDARSLATVEEAGEGGVPGLLGSNMLMRGDRARSMGFQVDEKSMLEHVEGDLAGYTF